MNAQNLSNITILRQAPVSSWKYHSVQSCEWNAAQPQPYFSPSKGSGLQGPSAHQHKFISGLIRTQIVNDCVTIKTGVF